MHVGIICYILTLKLIEALIFELAYNLRKLIVKMSKEYEIDELGWLFIMVMFEMIVELTIDYTPWFDKLFQQKTVWQFWEESLN